jgi:Protein of unknown function (DUF2628)
VRFYSTHLKAHQEPVLIPESFSWGAMILGPVWLAAHRAWISAAIALAVYILLALLFNPNAVPVLLAGEALLLGLTGNDLRRWSLERRGYVMTNVFAARNQLDAFRTLLESRPDLADRFRPWPT